MLPLACMLHNCCTSGPIAIQLHASHSLRLLQAQFAIQWHACVTFAALVSDTISKTQSSSLHAKDVPIQMSHTGHMQSHAHRARKPRVCSNICHKQVTCNELCCRGLTSWHVCTPLAPGRRKYAGVCVLQAALAPCAPQAALHYRLLLHLVHLRLRCKKKSCRYSCTSGCTARSHLFHVRNPTQPLGDARSIHSLSRILVRVHNECSPY
mmetsp:Transcript_23228/g.64167  ORF Transcript_23228/g.64167 Transcript_23228/m.64167 type:complete len:209 (-) Transcript_23228:657-1283(-)